MKRALIFYFLLLLINPINAQKIIIYKGLDGGKYVAPVKKSKYNTKDLLLNNNIVMSPAHLLRGVAVLGYERNIDNRFSAKISGGYCYGKDNMLNTFFIHKSLNNYNYSKDIYTYNKYYKTKKSDNYYSDLSARVYTNLRHASIFWEDFRWYISLQYRNYKQNFNPLNEDITPSSINKISVNNNALLIQIGEMGYFSNGLEFEYYIGFGKLNSNYNAYNYDATINKFIYNSTKSFESRNHLVAGINYGINF